MTDTWPDAYQTMKDVLVHAGIEPETAKQLCHKISYALGGAYLPRMKETSPRNEKIMRARLNGVKVKDIADRFGLSQRQIRRILKEDISF